TRVLRVWTHPRLRAARSLTPHPPAIAEARAKNRFRKLIRITGTRFSRRKRSDNSASTFCQDPFQRPDLPWLRHRKKARNKFRAFVISVRDGLSSPYHPYHPCHHQACPAPHFPSSAFRR